MADEKILNTRIVLKNDTLENWNGSSIVLKAGEVALAKIEAPQSGTEPKVPTYLMKVGNGESTFTNLNWLAASAADVYSWAKKPSLAYEDLPEVLRTEIDNLQAALGDGSSVADTVKNAIDALDVTDAEVTNQFVTAVKQEDGKIAVTRRALSAADIPTLGIDKITGLSDKLTALENADTANSNAITEINNKIGEVAADKTLVQMIADAQAAATYDDTAIKADIKANSDAIDIIEADYLKAADKTELSNAIALKANQADLEAEIARAKAAEQANADAITLLTDGVDQDKVDGVKDLINYVETHGAEVTGMKEDIQANTDAIAALKDGSAVVGNATNAENAENAKEAEHATNADNATNADSAKEADHATNADNATNAEKAVEADHAAVADKIGEIAAADVATKSDVATAKQEAIETAATNATNKANAAKEAANEYSDSLIAALNAQLAVSSSKNVVTGVTQANGKVTAITETTLADIAFSGSTDDLIQGSKTLVLDCGNSSTVI